MNTYRPKGEEEVVEAHLEERVTAFPDQGHCGRESVSRHLWRGSRGRQRTEGHTPCPHAPSQLSFSSVCLWREQVQAWGGRIGDVKWSLKCCLRFCTRYLSFKLKLRNFYFLQMSDHKILGPAQVFCQGEGRLLELSKFWSQGKRHNCHCHHNSCVLFPRHSQFTSMA